MTVAMVVDDQAVDRMLLSGILRKQGCEVVEYPGSHEALTALREIKVDIIFADVLMPEESGITFTAKVRAMGITVPVVIVSGAMGRISREFPGLTAQAGADLSLSKPIRVSDVAAIVANFLG